MAKRMTISFLSLIMIFTGFSSLTVHAENNEALEKESGEIFDVNEVSNKNDGYASCTFAVFFTSV